MAANAQRVFPDWIRFGARIFDDRELDPVLRELAILQVATMTPGAEYEWIQHAAITLAVGGTQEEVDAVAEGRHDALSDDGRLVVRFTEQVVRDAAPDEATFAEMTARFSTREIMHLVFTIGQYMTVARVMAVSQIDLEPAMGDDTMKQARMIRDRA